MKPSSLRRRQTSSLSRETGTSSRSCFARWALRIRVSRSAMGSVMLIESFSPSRPLPARLDHAGQIALQRQIPQVDATQPELAVDTARAATDPAPVAVADLELQLLPLLRDLCRRRHNLLLACERHAELAQQEQGALVVAGRRHDRDVHPLRLLDLVVVDLGEDQLVPDA